MRRMLVAAPLLLVACAPGEQASFYGCKTMSSTSDIPVTPTVDTTQLRRTASGLGIQDLVEGSGKTAEARTMVAVHYTGWLTNGYKFDSSRDRGNPYVFPLGQGQVVAGWDEGIAGMKVGGRRKLVIPPALGYGDVDNGPIPAGSTMVFDVELCAVK